MNWKNVLIARSCSATTNIHDGTGKYFKCQDARGNWKKDRSANSGG